MNIILNDTTISLPESPADVTLGDRIRFQQEYGNRLDAILKDVLDDKDAEERRLTLTHYRFEKAISLFAFFTNCTEDAVRELEDIDFIEHVYNECLSKVFEEPEEKSFSNEITWNDELWSLPPAVVLNGSLMTFGEFIDSKQSVSSLVDAGKSRWDILLNVCAIYLRKKDEPYREEFLYEDSERMRLMETLPFNLALEVGFFLTKYQNTCQKIFRYSSLQK